MNKMLTSAMAIGAGMAVYNYAANNNKRKMKRLGRKMTRALF